MSFLKFVGFFIKYFVFFTKYFLNLGDLSIAFKSFVHNFLNKLKRDLIT